MLIISSNPLNFCKKCADIKKVMEEKLKITLELTKKEWSRLHCVLEDITDNEEDEEFWIEDQLWKKISKMIKERT
jgi:hypothetical protein